MNQGSTGPTGPLSSVTGPTGLSYTGSTGSTGGIGAIMSYGYITVALASSSAFATTGYDFTNFPSAIGTWSTPAAAYLNLTFNASYNVSSVPPNINGTLQWKTTAGSGNLYVVPISPGVYLSGYVQTVLDWTGTNWRLSLSIVGSPFASPNTNANSTILYLTVFN